MKANETTTPATEAIEQQMKVYRIRLADGTIIGIAAPDEVTARRLAREML